jgi:hypothetical protein
LSQIADIDETLKYLRGRYHNVPVHTQAEANVGYTMQDTGVKAKQTTENVVDMMGAEQDKSVLGVSHYFNMGQKSDMTIQKFFERPVMISSGTFSLGTY